MTHTQSYRQAAVVAAILLLLAFKPLASGDTYRTRYLQKINSFIQLQETLVQSIRQTDFAMPENKEKVAAQLTRTRIAMKGVDFWLRYLEPLAQKKINGPLPVEWETEVFEKFEKPYKREGTGMTLAFAELEEEQVNKDKLLSLLQPSAEATRIFVQDSIVNLLHSPYHFFFCNRLFLLNLAAIYTTGFECPDTSAIIPELRAMLRDVHGIYTAFNESFSETPLPAVFMEKYEQLLRFVEKQPAEYSSFDHYTFIREYVNPLFVQHQALMKKYNVRSRSTLDYSLNKNATSIFDKELYFAQNAKGVFLRVQDKEVLTRIENLGKLLFHDPILSGNNQRSCASCHKPTEFFTDTANATALQFDRVEPLARNSPSLVNALYNHLIMQDGSHISLQDQAKGVILSPIEMGGSADEVVQKVMSCNEYREAFTALLPYTPTESTVSIEHIASAITMYYAKFSRYYSSFDYAMNGTMNLDEKAQRGFNLFMSRAQCATCHFVPQFNGIKPPYVSSEFEVLGVPADSNYSALSSDKGRYIVNPAEETLSAFRTGTVRNAEHTKPYMHNGVFRSLDQLLEFYNGGGGQGRKLKVENQTLSSDSLHLSAVDKHLLIAFMQSLNEDVEFETPPPALPKSSKPELNTRMIGGVY